MRPGQRSPSVSAFGVELSSRSFGEGEGAHRTLIVETHFVRPSSDLIVAARAGRSRRPHAFSDYDL